MAVAGTTANYNFIKPIFRGSFWHESMWTNLDRIDALLAGIAGDLDFVINNWANSTVYIVTDRVIDTVDASSWQCLVGHTSGASPQTMAQYRAANPTHWVSLANTLAVRGAWAQNTAYARNDITYDASEHVYAICVTAHTSTGIGTIRTDAVKWAYIADLDPFLVAAAASEAAAAASAAAAAASAASLGGVLTVHGDLLYRGAAALARLPIGSSTYVLTSNGAAQNPSWERGPAMTLLESGVASAVASKNIALDAYFGAGWTSFKVIIHNYAPVNDSTNLLMTISSDGGATYLVSYDWMESGVTGVTAFSFGYVGQSSMGLFPGLVGNAAAESGSCEINLFNAAATAYYGKLLWETMAADASGNPCTCQGGGIVNTAGDMTDIKFTPSGGNISTMTYSLYGLK